MAKRKEIERKKVETEHVKGLLLLLYLGAIFSLDFSSFFPDYLLLVSQGGIKQR